VNILNGKNQIEANMATISALLNSSKEELLMAA